MRRRPPAPRRRPFRPRRLALGAAKAAAVALFLAWSLGPILLILAASFTPERDIFALPWPRLLAEPTLAHYAELWRRWPGFPPALLNSLAVTLGATALALAASLPAGWAYSRARGRWLEGSALWLLGVRLVPPIVLTLPLFPAANALGLADTRLWLVLLYAAFFVSLGAYVMRAFVDRIPRELDEAAAVDGAGPLRTLVRVIAPLAAPGLLALGVFVAVFAWNEFLFAFVFSSVRAKTAPMVLSEIAGDFDGLSWGVLFAATCAQLAPVLLGVVLMQRHLVAGLTAGATKG